MEYQKADGSWETFKDNISLGNGGDVTLDLPVYVDGKSDSAVPTTYRAVELVPDAYTSMSYGEGEFEQTYQPDGLSLIHILSPMYDLDRQNELAKDLKLEDFGTMTGRKWLAVACLVAAMGLIVYGSILKGWDVAEHAAVFLALGIVVGLVAGFNPSEISREFLTGCKSMLLSLIHI